MNFQIWGKKEKRAGLFVKIDHGLDSGTALVSLVDEQDSGWL